MMRKTRKKTVDELINDNMGLVHTMIVRLARGKQYCDYEDLFAQARLGLIIAANEFDQDRGVAFSTFASKIIKREIINFKDADSIYVNQEPSQPTTDTSDDGRLELIFDEIAKLPESDQNVLMLYFSNAPDLSSVLNKIVNEKRVESLLNQIKEDIA